MADPPPISPAADLALRRYTTVMSYMATECSMFWSRSQLFLVANSALIGFLAKDIPLPGAPQNITKLWIYLSLSVVGLALCTLWHIMIHVGSRWIDWWQQKMCALEPDAYDSTILWRQRPDTGPWKARDVARATAILFTIIWLALFLYILCLFIT